MSGPASGGSNILRGGKRTYDCKTLVGNFVEEAYRPNAIKASWGGGDLYATTAQCQMNNGVGVTTPLFGAGLKKQEDPRYDYHQIIAADKTRVPSTWKSVAHSVHSNDHKATEFAAPQGMRGRSIPEDELEKHRQRWTTESEEMRALRYTTELSAATDRIVQPAFRKELTKPTQVSFK